MASWKDEERSTGEEGGRMWVGVGCTGGTDQVLKVQ